MDREARLEREIRLLRERLSTEKRVSSEQQRRLERYKEQAVAVRRSRARRSKCPRARIFIYSNPPSRRTSTASARCARSSTRFGESGVVVSL